MKSVLLTLTLALTLTPCEALPLSPCDWFATEFSLEAWNAVAAHPSVAIPAIQKALLDCPDKRVEAEGMVVYLQNGMLNRRDRMVADPEALADSIAYHTCTSSYLWSSERWNPMWKDGKYALADRHWAKQTDYEFDWAEDFGYGLGLVLFNGKHLFIDHQGHRYPAAFSMQAAQSETEALYLSGYLPMTHSKESSQFPKVKILIVDAEALPNISVTAAQFPGLETLIIHGLQASDRGQEKPLPITLPGIPSLRKLVIARAQPLNLPAALMEMPHLQTLHLIRTHLERLPSEIERLQEMEELIVENQGLGRLPGGFEDLRKLRRLSLADCGMKEFPDVIFKLDSLQALDLSLNAFGTLPSQISALTELRWLNLRWAQLTEIPAELSTLQKLEYLNLCENAFQNWPMGNAKMPVLKELDLHNNFHKMLDLNPAQLPVLCNLNLSDSYAEMSAEALAQLTQIQVLDLSDLLVDELPEGLKKLKQLRYLRLKTDNNPLAPVVIEEARKQVAKWLPDCKVILR